MFDLFCDFFPPHFASFAAGLLFLTFLDEAESLCSQWSVRETPCNWLRVFSSKVSMICSVLVALKHPFTVPLTFPRHWVNVFQKINQNAKKISSKDLHYSETHATVAPGKISKSFVTLFWRFYKGAWWVYDAPLPKYPEEVGLRPIKCWFVPRGKRLRLVSVERGCFQNENSN